MSDRLDEGVRWVISRPPSIKALLRRFPPACSVVATRPLLCPPPGAVGRVVSYFESGAVSVQVEGIDFRGTCEPGWLEVVGYHEHWTAEYVAALLDGGAE